MLIDQIPRHALILLMMAQALAVIPHLSHLPFWVVAVWLAVCCWRVQIFRGRWGFPVSIFKVAAVILCFSGVYVGYGKIYGLEPMVGVLIAAFVLKLLEMKQRRDTIIVVFLGYFVIATQFLFFTTLNSTLYGLLCLLLMTAALIALHQTSENGRLRGTLGRAGVMVLQSVPLMLVLFFVVPKMGSLWALPSLDNSAQTGVSDTMSPGDFSRLSQSREVAFRVSFEGEKPPQDSLYWRGLVLSYFDGRTWHQSSRTQQESGQGYDGSVHWYGRSKPQWLSTIEPKGDTLRYQVTIEPTQQMWLYSLRTPIDIDTTMVGAGRRPPIGLTRDYRLVASAPIAQRRLYHVDSGLDYRLEANGLNPKALQQATQLPSNSNPESVRRARLWYMAGGSDTNAYIDRLLALFNQQFTYTLQPPVLGTHSVDEFLWQSKAGFCEHFASSFVFMLRAVGIPARVVVGYQGGELNTLDDYVMVRQMDAHAWAEVWLPEQGWVRFDPTASVAPQRIELGLDSSLSESDNQLLSSTTLLDNYRSIAWVNQLRLRWDSLNYSWQSWVLGFDRKDQLSFLANWLGEVKPLRIAILLLGVGSITIFCIWLWHWWCMRPEPLTPCDKYYRRFLRKLQRLGYQRHTGEAPHDFAQRIAKKRPDLAAQIFSITELYVQGMYAQNDQAEQPLAQKVNRFSPKRRLSGQLS